MMEFQATEASTKSLDEGDDLAEYRDDFYRESGQISLDGNSLGLLSVQAEATILRVLDEWKRLAVQGWTEASTPWFFLAEELAKAVAPLVGAKPGRAR